MRNIKLVLLLVAVSISALILGCNNSTITDSKDIQFNYTINAWDYSDNCYLPDTLYLSSFKECYNTETGIVSPLVYNNKILVNNPDFSIWVQCDITNRSKRYAAAFTQLYERPSGGYPDSLFHSADKVGFSTSGFFEKLNTSEYYINEISGVIILKINIPNSYNIGITYSTYSGKRFGRGDTEASPNDTLILKMFKVANCNPEETPLAWELKLKNIYKIPFENIKYDSFYFNVYFNSNATYSLYYPFSNKLLIQLLKLDKYTGITRLPPPDGGFDFLPDYTILPDIGYVIFPSLKPFSDSFLNQGVDTTYCFPEIYSNTKSYVTTLPKASLYSIQGHGE
jgi:cell surface protein SprA